MPGIGAALAFIKGHKAIALAVGAALLAIAVLVVVDRIYGKGERAGRSEVTTKVQTETIRKIDEARTEREKANEEVRGKPIDSVIDGLR